MRRPSAALSREWDRRLKDSGLKDIEPSPGGLLSGGSAGVRVESLAERAEYADAMSRVSTIGWPRFERQVFELHRDGFTIVESARQLGTYKRRVHETLQRILSERVQRQRKSKRLRPHEVRSWVRRVDAETFHRVLPEILLATVNRL